jgi:NADH-quinone oxidoreductase subunit J
MEKIMFYLLAVIIIVFALLSVTSRKLYRATMYLLFVLIAVSGFYFIMEYNFMGAVQLSVYAGGIMVLFVYAVMLTDKIGEPLRSIPTKWKIFPAIVTAITAMLAIYAIYSYQGINVKNEATVTTVEQVGEKLLTYEPGGFVLPFEVISVLLLAAMIGAIVIAKAKKMLNKENK